MSLPSWVILNERTLCRVKEGIETKKTFTLKLEGILESVKINKKKMKGVFFRKEKPLTW